MLVHDLVIDPARAKELINPEFVPDGAFLITANERGCVGYRYDALPAAAAAEPTAFGCLIVEREGVNRAPALVALTWDGVVTRCHVLTPVDVRTTTVAAAAGESIPGGEGDASISERAA